MNLLGKKYHRLGASANSVGGAFLTVLCAGSVISHNPGARQAGQAIVVKPDETKG